MSNVEISESDQFKTEKNNDDNEIGELYGDKGYSKIPLDQINLETEPISITNDYSYSIFDSNIKSYIKVFLGFAIFIIILFTISILSGHFHYHHKDNINEIEGLKNKNINNKMSAKKEDILSKTPIQSFNNQTINSNENLTNKNNTFYVNVKK